MNNHPFYKLISSQSAHQLLAQVTEKIAETNNLSTEQKSVLKKMSAKMFTALHNFVTFDPDRRFIPFELETVVAAILAAVILPPQVRVALCIISLPFVVRNGCGDIQHWIKEAGFRSAPYAISLLGQVLQGLGLLSSTCGSTLESFKADSLAAHDLDTAGHELLGLGTLSLCVACLVSLGIQTNDVVSDPEKRTLDTLKDMLYNTLFTAGGTPIGLALLNKDLLPLWLKYASIPFLIGGSFGPNLEAWFKKPPPSPNDESPA